MIHPKPKGKKISLAKILTSFTILIHLHKNLINLIYTTIVLKYELFIEMTDFFFYMPLSLLLKQSFSGLILWQMSHEKDLIHSLHIRIPSTK